MKIALVSFCGKDDSKASVIAREIASSAREKGADVESFDGIASEGRTRLTLFDYIAVLAKKKGFFRASLPSSIGEFLDSAPPLAGKKGAAIIIKAGGFGNGKACAVLMRLLEGQGVFLDYSDIIGGVEAARACGKKLG